MRLGIVLRGFGAHGAAGAGALLELRRRGIEPWAAVGQHAGAWPAALFAAGATAAQIEAAIAQAGRVGPRLLSPRPTRAVLRGELPAMAGARRLEGLLAAQALERPLSACPRAAAFPCRSARDGRGVVFATRACPQEPGETVTRQATAGFAARAAMALPPYLPPLDFLGAPLLPDGDAARACRLLFALGAQRALVVEPVPAAQGARDALDMTALCMAAKTPLPEGTAVLRVRVPEGALALSRIPAIAQAGRDAARDALDALLECLGVRLCRVLPFRKRRE